MAEGAPDATPTDRRMMAAAIRLSLRHAGLTGSNPSVATLVVREDGDGPVIVGRGITALGGRPHAEAEALGEAGDRAKGATAYVTLEPCAHHGRTPPCAEALVRAGIKRVVAATMDPDHRVSGRGFAILRNAGIEVVPQVLDAEARFALAGYLMQRTRNRPHVTLKLAISADGKIGKAGAGQIAITNAITRGQVHVLRAQSDAILVGVGTALADDPLLTCRLPGLADRSPVRIVLDTHLRLPATSRLMAEARHVPVLLATAAATSSPSRQALADAGAGFIACDTHNGRIALPELLDDLGARGLSTLLVEGGGAVASAFLRDDLVDRLVLHTGAVTLGHGAIDAPFTHQSLPLGFRQSRQATHGDDILREYERHR